MIKSRFILILDKFLEILHCKCQLLLVPRSSSNTLFLIKLFGGRKHKNSVIFKLVEVFENLERLLVQLSFVFEDVHKLVTHHFPVRGVDDSYHHVKHDHKHKQNLDEVKDLDHVDLDVSEHVVRGFHQTAVSNESELTN